MSFSGEDNTRRPQVKPRSRDKTRGGRRVSNDSTRSASSTSTSTSTRSASRLRKVRKKAYTTSVKQMYTSSDNEDDMSDEETGESNGEESEEDDGRLSGGSSLRVNQVDCSDSAGRERKLASENEALQVQIRELHAAMQKKTKFCGKNKVRKKNLLTVADRLNAAQINDYLKKNLLPIVKFLPRKWMKYNDKNPRAVCYRIMAIITVHNLMKREDYWASTLCPMVNEKWCAMLANIKEYVRHQYLGEHSC